MKVYCTVSEIDLEGDNGSVASVSVECGRCGHETEAYGTSDESIRRCMVMLREECPSGEHNFYVEEGSEDDLPPEPQRRSDPYLSFRKRPDTMLAIIVPTKSVNAVVCHARAWLRRLQGEVVSDETLAFLAALDNGDNSREGSMLSWASHGGPPARFVEEIKPFLADCYDQGGIALDQAVLVVGRYPTETVLYEIRAQRDTDVRSPSFGHVSVEDI